MTHDRESRGADRPAERDVHPDVPAISARDLPLHAHLGERRDDHGTYSCDLSILGVDFIPGCQLKATATERVE